MNREEELKYLDNTIEIIDELILEKENKIEGLKSLIVDEKSHLWKNLYEYTDPEMYSRMEEEDVKVDIINSEIIKTNKLYRAKETPYFGKIVFNGENIYLGLTNITKDLDTYCYDWRAPISNLYYNYEIGDAEYRSQDEIIKGKITSKRQFIIEMGKLKDYFDLDVAIDDKVLQDVLKSNKDDKMKNIVSTIQKEQNEIIRYTGSKDLIIQGIAGSGKTEIALHRIAYELYNKENLTEKNVTIFSPNLHFTEYISNVLPELGEENAEISYYNIMLQESIHGFTFEPVIGLIERWNEGLVDREEAKYKLSTKYREDIDTYINNYINKLKFNKSIGLKATLVEKSTLNRYLHTSTKNLSLADRLEYIANKLCDTWDINGDKYSTKLKLKLMDMLEMNTEPMNIYNDFLKSVNLKELDSKDVHYEDMFGLSYLYFELFGYPSFSHIKEVVIDEAQDYTYNDYVLLRKIYSSAAFTILGDINQMLNPCNSLNSLKDLNNIFTNYKYITLNNSYRSSYEITNYTKKLINNPDIHPIQRPSGNEIIFREENILKKDLEKDIKYLKDKGYKKIAIITKTSKDAYNIGNLISDKLVEIFPVCYAKGLEYDAVISYNNRLDPYEKEEIKWLYTALTRAEHELIIYNK